jgi:hypothetical protein
MCTSGPLRDRPSKDVIENGDFMGIQLCFNGFNGD